VGLPGGADCNAEGVILFTTTGTDGALRRVSASGGTPQIVFAPDTKSGEVDIWWPAFLPDGRHFLYLSLGPGRTALGIHVASLDSTGRTLVMKGGSNVRFANERVLFLRGGTLMSQRFDTQNFQLQGEAVPVAERVQMFPPTGAFTVSQTGVLAYKSGQEAGASHLIWFDEAGRQLGTIGNSGAYADLHLSPDGKRAAVSLPDPSTGARDIWLVDLARDLMTRFTFDGADEHAAIWSPDGNRLAFRSNRSGTFDLFEKPSNGAGAETILLADKTSNAALSWSADGRFLLYGKFAAAQPAGAGAPPDLWVLPSDGDRKPFPFLSTPFAELPARFSPDGRWVAFTSNESGRQEVYLVPFPGPGGKWQVSTQGGSAPVWRRDGKELFFLSPDVRLMAAPVSLTSSGADIGAVRPLFQLRPGGIRSVYDVTPDGRFLVISSTDRPDTTPITLVVNWAPKE
jgi:dipeptidyl aminopeptidase/acylaminoacyl peptidase